MHPLAATEMAAADEPGEGVPFRAKTGHIHQTWARTFSSLPELYVQPQSEAEVEKAVSLARRCRRRIVVTGSGHSPSDLTCTSSWMLNLDRLDAVVGVDTARREIVVQAGMRLRALCDELARHGLALANLGSIDEQSVAGALATGTHGSSMRHGLLSEHVAALRITLASGETVACSAQERRDLFAAALLSLGALGVVTEVTLRVVPAFWLSWRQTIDADANLLTAWEQPNSDLWTANEFVRVWWFPHTRRAVTWRADKTPAPADGCPRPPPRAFCDRPVGRAVYHGLLYLAQWVPRILPYVEWFVFGMHYGFANGGGGVEALQPGRNALLMDCMYAQLVNEWAVPLHRGPEALRRLGAWLNGLRPGDEGYVEHGIPFEARGVYVHAPVEVRVSDTTRPRRSRITYDDNDTKSKLVNINNNDDQELPPRPFLDPTIDTGPTLFLNATLYRPFFHNPPCAARYYQAFEWLMRDLGGRPHWAKNFAVSGEEIEAMYGSRLEEFRRVRARVDPEGLFVGPWHRRNILVGGGECSRLEFEEV